MSYALSRLAGTFALVASVSLVGCSAPAEDIATGTTTSDLGEGSDSVVTFGGNWQVNASAPLTVGHKVTVQYDASRLTNCRGDYQGHAGWLITGFYRLNGGAVQSFEAGGFSPSGGTAKPEIALGATGDLEIWFQNTSIYGCSAYDSAFGKNYHFTVLPSANAPGWMGNARFATSRATCNAGPCEADLHPLDGGFTYDTWTRQRAAIRQVQFEVWKQGTTDHDNPNLWRELDVQVHSRVGSTGAFQTRYVSFDGRTGNNARYALDLRTLDPIDPPGTLATKAACPTFPVTYEGAPGNDYIDADLQFYFTVNGSELRPADGTVFHGKYQNYAGLYAVCR
jgi:hypothetical protein